ncbi:MAG TPA: aminoglycoside phosphotransferase family protein [Bacteroidales bacterium]|nr:aminoglycoside phosphotransferase family protein [Bacteroidales bacterium]
MSNNIEGIFSLFSADGTFLKSEVFGNGHIHDTFRIVTSEKEKDDYILQRLNNKIFKNIPQLQHNIELVTNHILNKLKNTPGADIKRGCLRLVPAKNGTSWLQDQDQNTWRMYVYIPDHKSFNVVDSPDMAYEGGRAVGKFQAMLSDLPGESLFDTIPFFHDVEKRLETFMNVIKNDPVKRVPAARNEIKLVLDRAEKMKIILRLGKEGKIPLRITHNDTKFNNILFDTNNKALCIIDLDTVMPGYVHYDFGDAIRTATNTAAEDEPDLSKIEMNISLFRAYSEGFLSETSQTLNLIEKEYLAFAPGLVTYIMGLRFLTDYIDGDNYYKIHHEHHNLQRAKAQLKLVRSMEEQYADMQSIIKNII